MTLPISYFRFYFPEYVLKTRLPPNCATGFLDSLNQRPERAADFFVPGQRPSVYTGLEERSVTDMGRRGGGCRILGILAVALGAGILIAAIFPTGALLFLVAFLLIACGCACCKF